VDLTTGGVRAETRSRDAYDGAQELIGAPRVVDLACQVPVCRPGETEDVEQLSDLVLGLRRVAHPDLAVEDIAVAPTHALARHIPGVDEVGDDSLRRSLGYPDCRSHVA
jgi:hypothetical protein